MKNRPQATLSNLFVAMTLWCGYFGLLACEIPERIPESALNYAMVAAIGAVSAVYVYCKNSVQAALIAMPFLAILNWISMFVVFLLLETGVNDVLQLGLWMTVTFICFPTLLVQNCIPLAGVWDTMVAVPIVSVVQGTLLAWLTAVVRNIRVKE